MLWYGVKIQLGNTYLKIIGLKLLTTRAAAYCGLPEFLHLKGHSYYH